MEVDSISPRQPRRRRLKSRVPKTHSLPKVTPARINPFLFHRFSSCLSCASMFIKTVDSPAPLPFDPSGGEGQAVPGYGAGGTPALPGGASRRVALPTPHPLVPTPRIPSRRILQKAQTQKEPSDRQDSKSRNSFCAFCAFCGFCCLCCFLRRLPEPAAHHPCRLNVIPDCEFRKRLNSSIRLLVFIRVHSWFVVPLGESPS